MNYKRVVASTFGRPEVLQVREEELKQPAPGEVLVRVYAAGVARGDVSRRKYDWAHQTPPFSLGYDFAGEVAAIGSGVTSFSVGQTVAGINENLDSYSEYVLVNPSWMVAIQDNVNIVQAACLGLNYLVAIQCLHRIAGVKEGERILILGASGGIGTALIELGKLAGLEIYGTAATTKVEQVRELGAIPIDYQNKDLSESIKDIRFDAVFDGIFDTHLDSAYNRLRAKGKYVTFGFTAPPEEYEILIKRAENWNATHNDDKDMINFGILEPYTEDLSKLASLLATGKINPMIYEQIPMTEAVRAHQLLESGSVTGKIVLICK